MLKKHLSSAIETLEKLIETTEQDIANIKEAKHSAVDESVRVKNALIKNFEENKRDLDKELVRLSKVDSSKSLAEMLDDEIKGQLVLMRQKLEELNKKNKEYARHVVLVKEFFDSLAKEIFKPESSEYNASANTTYKSRV